MTVSPHDNDLVSRGELFGQYAPAVGTYDETFSEAGRVRPHWQRFVAALEAIGPQELARRWKLVEQIVREDGMMYNAFGDPDDKAPLWELDALPLLIGAGEWRALSAGLIQRARLLDRILADLYGPQKLLTEGLLPAEWVFSHPGFQRAFHGRRLPGNRYLHFYAADLVRAPDGAWWVVSDRTDAPLGAGYTLKDRIVTSRTLPSVIHDCRVERLAPFFIALRETLEGLAPARRENPRIVLLSQGPGHRSYFEDAYLARYLGYTLVETGDLAVRDDHVYLKTLGGLLPVDVIFRRLSDRHCDPLELRGDARQGIAGLIQAVRSGNVAVANALGSSLVESGSLLAFLPKLCPRLLGESLQLPSVATWWCGQSEARAYALANLDRLAIRSAYRVDRQELFPPEYLRDRPQERLAAAIAADPAMFLAREQVVRSSMPALRDQRPEPARLAWRVFLVASGDTYVALPGGLVRVARVSQTLDFSVLHGDLAKDVWILSEGPVRPVSLLRPPEQPIELRRSGAELPSRVADNLFWLGRYAERVEGAARLLRTILGRLTSEWSADHAPDLTVLLRLLASRGELEPGFVIDGIRQQLPAIEKALPPAILDEHQPGSLRSAVATMYHNAYLVRDRISLDCWRITHRIQQQVQQLARQPLVEPSDVLDLIDRMIIDLAAFDGLVAESMTRTQAWRFLDLGRRLERSLQTLSFVQGTLSESPEPSAALLEAILETADSIMTYRARYLATFQRPPVLDLLLTDETNPRSLAFQLAALADHVEYLPRDRSEPLRGPEQRIAMTALNGLRLLDAKALSATPKPGQPTRLGRVLQQLADRLPRLAELISHKYLVHAGTPRQLADLTSEPDL